jgi:hypothetical protein
MDVLERRNQVRKTFKTTGPLTLRARIASGDIAVEATDAGETIVELEPRNEAAERLVEEVRVEMRADELLIEVPERRGLFGRGPEFDLRVACPAGSSVESRSASADVHIRGRLKDVDVTTASGDIQVEQSDGETRITSASGDVELGSGRGPVSVSATSGDVRIGRAAAGLRINLVSGDLGVHEVEGGLTAEIISGEVDVAAVSPGAIHVKTVSGDVRVGVKAGCDVWMDVRSVSGHTSSELEGSDGPPADRSSLVELEISTMSGDVSIKRAETAAQLPQLK